MISGDTVFFVSHSDSRRLTSLYRIRYIRSFLVGVYSADEFRSTTRALDVRAHPPYCRIVRPALRSLLQRGQSPRVSRNFRRRNSLGQPTLRSAVRERHTCANQRSEI